MELHPLNYTHLNCIGLRPWLNKTLKHMLKFKHMSKQFQGKYLHASVLSSVLCQLGAVLSSTYLEGGGAIFYMVTFLTISRQERKLSIGREPTGTSGMCKVLKKKKRFFFNLICLIITLTFALALCLITS